MTAALGVVPKDQKAECVDCAELRAALNESRVRGDTYKQTMLEVVAELVEARDTIVDLEAEYDEQRERASTAEAIINGIPEMDQEGAEDVLRDCSRGRRQCGACPALGCFSNENKLR